MYCYYCREYKNNRLIEGFSRPCKMFYYSRKARAMDFLINKVFGFIKWLIKFLFTYELRTKCIKIRSEFVTFSAVYLFETTPCDIYRNFYWLWINLDKRLKVHSLKRCNYRITFLFIKCTAYTFKITIWHFYFIYLYCMCIGDH